MPIDHTCIHVPEAKFQECLKVYVEALKPLGYEVRQQFGEMVVGLGSTSNVVANYKPADFWVVGKDGPNHAIHFAFRAADRAKVDAFHAAALKAGAKDNGAPGLRGMYHPHYYAAFVRDPAGNNVEAVCHDAQ